MGHAVLWVSGVQTRNIHQIGNDRAGRGLRPRTFAVIQGGANGVALHHHRIHGAFHVCNQALGRNKAWMHTQLDALGATFGDAQKLDAITQLFGVLNVCRAQLGDALDVRLVELHRNTKGYGRHDGGLMGCVYAFNVKSRIGFGIAQALGFFKYHAKIQPFVAHFAQDEVGGAVDDASNPLDAVGGQALAQCLDDGYATGHRCLKSDHHALGRCGSKNFRTVHGQKRLVGRYYMLASRDSFHHQRFGDSITTDQLDDDINFRIGNDSSGVVNHLYVWSDRSLSSGCVQIGHHRDFYATTGAALNFLLIALEHIESARAHHANAQQAYLNRFHTGFKKY